MSIDSRRLRVRNTAAATAGPVVYWMQRDQRVQENWALLYAQEQAIQREVPLAVVYNIAPLGECRSLRQYDFLLTGLAKVAAELQALHIHFAILHGEPTEQIVNYVAEHNVGEVVMDFQPLEPMNSWRHDVAAALSIKCVEVDAHNIIPAWVVSEKEEFAAYTFRPKVHRALTEFLTMFPLVQSHPCPFPAAPTNFDTEALLSSVDCDRVVLPVDWIASGSTAAKAALQQFVTMKLDGYAVDRNSPLKAAVSDLSPYLHFGQLSAQFVASTINKAYDNDKTSREAFLEELIVRRELADNYCLYNKKYNKVVGAHAWAQKTIAEHATDAREYLYDRAVLESSQTHDELWNALQTQMVIGGKMHGWGRMYWAKKILEWTPDVQTAIDTALYLNDTYELDGNDPNGVVGVMWSICGVHDRAWGERAIFGKVRYMNFAGAKRKFDVAAFVAKYSTKQQLFND